MNFCVHVHVHSCRFSVGVSVCGHDTMYKYMTWVVVGNIHAHVCRIDSPGFCPPCLRD